MDKFYITIEKELGKRRKNLTEDQYQIFWVGVLKALKTVDKNRDIIPYLILRGFGEVKNQRRSEFSHKYLKYCPVCGKSFGFRTQICKLCNEELLIDNRQSEFVEHNTYDEDITNVVMIKQFVKTLSGKRRYVAQRWLIDRADLMYDNHLKQIAFELNISAPAVSTHKTKVQRDFLKWYHG